MQPLSLPTPSWKPLLALVAAAGLFAACGDPSDDPGDQPDPDPVVEAVDVTGPTLDLAPGERVQLTATAYDAAGAEVPGVAFTWESDRPGVATVTDAGLVTAVAGGEVTISASTGQVSGGVFLTVAEVEAPIAWIELEPAGEVELAAGATLQLAATAYGADGEVLLGRALTWTSGDPAVATVSSTGLVTAVAPGAAAIAVEAEDQRDEMAVRVPVVTDPPVAVDHLSANYTELIVGVGSTRQLRAQPRDASGQPLERAVTWSSNNPAYVSVSADGLVTAHELGGADITAESEGKTVSIRVYVTEATGYVLETVDGLALPRSLGTYVHTVPGDGPRSVTVVAREGWMLIDHVAGTYELVLQAVTYSTAVSSALPFPRTYESTGTVSWDATAMAFVFEPSPFGEAFTGRWSAAGELDVTWQPEPALPAATFNFRLD